MSSTMSPGSRIGGEGLWPRIKRGLRRIGQVQAALLLSLIYVLIWVPAGLVTKAAVDWLRWRAPSRSNWWPRAERINTPTHVHESF